MTRDGQFNAPERNSEGSKNTSAPHFGNVMELYKIAPLSKEGQINTAHGSLPDLQIADGNSAKVSSSVDTVSSGRGQAPSSAADRADSSDNPLYSPHNVVMIDAGPKESGAKDSSTTLPDTQSHLVITTDKSGQLDFNTNYQQISGYSQVGVQVGSDL